MKVITLVAIICFILVSLISPAKAEIGLGYETLTVLPHTVTLYGWNKESGWGFKASADFGMSALAISASAAHSYFSFGTPENLSFYSFYATKDVNQKENYRNFFKFGGCLINASILGQIETIFVPSLGLGWEWQKLWASNWAFGVDAAYPELFNLGMRYYF
jgi:hypothetical protein